MKKTCLSKGPVAVCSCTTDTKCGAKESRLTLLWSTQIPLTDSATEEEALAIQLVGRELIALLVRARALSPRSSSSENLHMSGAIIPPTLNCPTIIATVGGLLLIDHNFGGALVREDVCKVSQVGNVVLL